MDKFKGSNLYKDCAILNEFITTTAILRQREKEGEERENK